MLNEKEANGVAGDPYPHIYERPHLVHKDERWRITFARPGVRAESEHIDKNGEVINSGKVRSEGELDSRWVRVPAAQGKAVPQ